MSNSLRIFYAAGPGDVVGTYRHWLNGQDDPSQVSMTYSGQFFDACRELDATGFVLSSCPRVDRFQDAQMTLENRPKPIARGIGYHLTEIRYGLHLAWTAWRFRADLAVIAEGTTHWFVLFLLPLLGIKLVPTVHCVLWPKFKAPGKAQQLLNRMAGVLFRRFCFAVMSASEDITEQIRQITGGQPRPVVPFLPTYRRETFANAVLPSAERAPFRVLFAGRIERNKGVFDLLEIARRFQREEQPQVEFDLCGTGSALEALRAAVEQAGVSARFRTHGHCSRDVMQQMLCQSHVIIVPTTTDFIEGFNQVVVESVLAGRPVITSSVCPAIACVREAVVEVPPDDVAAYGDAILRLQADDNFYEAKRRACLSYQEQFYDPAQGWSAALQLIAQAARTKSEVVPAAASVQYRAQ